MAKKSINQASSELYSLLEPFSSEERLRLVKATLALLGDTFQIGPNGGASNLAPDASQRSRLQNLNIVGKSESDYFEEKQVNTKVEQLAVAARFRELMFSAKVSTQEELKAVFSEARIDFDGNHFSRDIGNARTIGLFNRGSNVKDAYTLSLYGQKYVDALPNRDATKALSAAQSEEKQEGQS